MSTDDQNLELEQLHADVAEVLARHTITALEFEPTCQIGVCQDAARMALRCRNCTRVSLMCIHHVSILARSYEQALARGAMVQCDQCKYVSVSVAGGHTFDTIGGDL